MRGPGAAAPRMRPDGAPMWLVRLVFRLLQGIKAGRVPTLGPSAWVDGSGSPLADDSDDELRRRLSAREPLGMRGTIDWEPAPGAGAAALRCLPKAVLVVSAVSLLVALRRLLSRRARPARRTARPRGCRAARG